MGPLFAQALAGLLATGDMVPVPAGPFLRGDDGGEADERPRRRLVLSAFVIDRTEVSRGAYAACVVAGRCPPPAGGPGAADLPVTGVTWDEARAFCAFVGKRLPTEAEWEKAARGGDGRRYPWGEEFSCARGNFGSFDGEGRCAAEGAPGRPVPVGQAPRGASPYGALDMAGNVWEWVADRYDARYYARATPLDPRGPEESPQNRDAREVRRVLRGGGCCSIFGLPRTSDRLALPGSYQDVDIGFHCAR